MMNENENATRAPAVDPDLWLDEYGDFLYRFALARVRDADVAEELVQETFVAGLNNKQQFTGQGTQRAWLLGILKNKLIDFYRKRKRDPIHLDDETGGIADRLFDKNGMWRKEIRSAIKQSLDSLDRQEFWAILKNCLGLLPARQADVFTMRTIDEQSSADICKELEITSSNYWVILHRARLQLASCLKQKWFQDLDG